MLYKKSRIVKIKDKKDIEKYITNHSKNIKLYTNKIVFKRMFYKDYNNEKLLHAMISDNYKLYIPRDIRLVFNDPISLAYRSTFIYVSKPF